ncbi:MAG: immunoglobulin domain-containing protein [Verrucomicrobia bacterium]|nr:immunoglobulin domain-containing protein [Verrucomicrobiota bacterium]
MKSLRLFARTAALAALLAGVAGPLGAEDYSVTTYAGTSNVAGNVDGAPGTFNNPYGIAMDAAKNLYVTDTVNNTIRKITTARIVSTLAGSPGLLGSTDGSGSAARFNFPVGIAVDASGNVYVADAKNFTIRKITSAGVVSTYAGAPSQLGSADGAAASARFFLPYGLAVDAAGSLYVADGGNHTIRRITAAGVVSTVAGAALQSGFANGTATAARFSTPWGLAVDRNGVLYVADSGNHVIRRIGTDGVVSTLAGSPGNTGSGDGVGAAARFNEPRGVTVDAAGNVYVADYGNNVLRMITPSGTVSTLAGAAGISGDIDSVGAAARFYYPTDVVADGTTVFVVDSSNNLIRRAAPASQAALPVISVHPLEQIVSVGQSVSFRVVASGSALTYTWIKNGFPISGATGSTYTIASPQAADEGVYSVRVGSAGGAIDSEQAPLSVLPVASGSISITARPLSQSVAVGQSVSFSVTATGPGLAYQWLKDGAAIAGATGATYTIGSASVGAAGTYTVRLTSGGSTVTASAKLVVGGSSGATVNITTQPASQTVNAGQSVTFTVAATGTSAVSYQWFKNDQIIAGATNSSYVIGAAQEADAGNYTARATAGGVNALSSTAVLTVIPVVTGPTSRLGNLSVRTAMSAGQTLIVGVVVSGGARELLVRAAGPALGAFGLSTAMADPRLELYNGSNKVFENDDWPASLAPTFSTVGAFPFAAGSRDAAFVQSVDGARSIQARGTAAGVVLVEAYDTGSGNNPRLINVSARNRVGTGDDILIAGFNVTGTGNKQLLIRAVGPKLGGFGVTGFLVDPKLEVYSSAGAKLTENDDWSATLAPTFTAVAAFPLDAGSKDAALLTTVAPGSYTVQVRGADGGTGEALIEIYEVP